MAKGGDAQLQILDEDELLTCCVCRSLLDDPQQLDCLHSCCRRCVDQVLSPSDEGSVVCPECCHVSDARDMATCPVIQTLVRRRRAITELMACASCSDQSEVTSLCTQCRGLLFTACCQFRSSSGSSLRCDETALTDETALSTLFNAATIQTSADFYGKAQCDNDSLASCSYFPSNAEDNKDSESRKIGSVGDKSCRGKLLASVASLEAACVRSSGTFVKRRELITKLKEAHMQRRQLLRQRKLQLLDSVEQAYSAADNKLDEIFEKLETTADRLAIDSERLQRSASYAVSYSRLVISADESYHVTRPQLRLLKRLERLSKEVGSTRCPVNVEALVAVKQTALEIVENTLANWIGIPTMITDELEPAGHDNDSEMQRLVVQHSSNISKFCQSSETLELAVDCYDLAITRDGRLLLAARERGLLECNVRGGELKTCYPPPLRPLNGKSDWIVTVDSTCDGRVAAGVHWQRLIVVLSDSSGKWHEVQRIADVLLNAQLSHISLHADVIAATGAASDCSGGGSALAIVSLGDGLVLHRQRRQYCVRSVAVTSLSLITACKSPVKLRDSSESSYNVVDAYNYLGDVHLWRYVLGDGERPMDVVYNFFDQTLYLAVERSDSLNQRHIVAVRVEDGNEIETSAGGGVIVDGETLAHQQLYRIALAVVGHDLSLAVLSYYTALLTLYTPDRQKRTARKKTTGDHRALGGVLPMLKLQKWQAGKTFKTLLKNVQIEKSSSGNQGRELEREGE